MSSLRLCAGSLIIATALCIHAPVVHADCRGPEPGTIVANPNRPTVANPADITQYGVLELEYGYERDEARLDQYQTNMGGLLKFAVTCNLEFRWNTTSFVNQSVSGSSQSGIGDNWLGFQYRLHRQSDRLPALAFSYSLKFPSASASKGLGSGRYDHQFTFLASKDVWGTHFDFNASLFRIGRLAGNGSDHNGEFNLAFTHSVYKKLAFTGEFYGDTRLGYSTPAYASGLWAISYAVTPRLVFDSGMDHGLTPGSPYNRRILVGLTYSIADLYTH